MSKWMWLGWGFLGSGILPELYRAIRQEWAPRDMTGDAAGNYDIDGVSYNLAGHAVVVGGDDINRSASPLLH